MRTNFVLFSETFKSQFLRFFYAIRFKLLNFRIKANHICLSPRLTLHVHEKAYYPFRYFTDFDNDMVEEMLSFLHFTRSSKCLIDVGAHYGIFSLAFSARSNAISFALEPSPNAFNILTANIQLNPQCNVIAQQVCASHSLDTVAMSVGDADHFVADPSKSVDTITVKAITLDSFFLGDDVVPDVIKIDVEGFELNVLKGAKELMNKHSPIIFLEIHPKELAINKTDVTQVVEFLDVLGYNFFNSKGHVLGKTYLTDRTQVTRVLCKRDVNN